MKEADPGSRPVYSYAGRDGEMSLFEIWLQFLRHKRLFSVVLVLAASISFLAVGSLFEPKFTVTSTIDAGSIMADGETIPKTYHQTLVNRVNMEIIPRILSEERYRQSSHSLTGVSVSLARGTSLIRIISRIPIAEIDQNEVFHSRLVDQIINELEMSYHLFNANTRNELLSIQSKIFDLKAQRDALNKYDQVESRGPGVDADTAESSMPRDGDRLGKELDILYERESNYENALTISRPRAVLIAGVSKQATGLSKQMAYALVVIASILFACITVLIVISFQKMREHSITGG